VTAIIGIGWSYVEQTPADDTVQITVPFAPGTENFLRISELIRRFTPANTDIQIQSVDGFILDESDLDLETFGDG
jgi:hypothetical protein